MRLRTFVRIVSCAMLAFIGLAGRAGPSNPRFTGSPLMRVWRAEDYGASALNTRVLIGRDGLVYVANDSGLLEFDGEQWRLISMPRGGAARALALDGKGRVWVFGHDDIARLEPDARGQLDAVSVLELLPEEARQTGTINRAVYAGDCVYARGQNRLMAFSDNGPVATWPGANLNGVVWTAGDTVYAEMKTLERVNNGHLEAVSLGNKAFAPEGARVFATKEVASNPHSWLIVSSRGPARWLGPGTPFVPLSPEAAAVLGTDVGSAGAFLQDGRIAVGTERSGLLIFTPDGALSQRVNRARGLPGDRINDLAIDSNGGLWIALQEGIVRLDLDSPFALHSEAQGLMGTARRFGTWQGSLYVATSEGVSRRDNCTGQFIPIRGFQVGANRPLTVGDRLVASTRGIREILADDSSIARTSELVGPIANSATAPGWIYAGSSSGLVALKPAKDGWATAWRVENLSDGADEILTRGGQIWMVTRDGEVAVLDEASGPKPGAASKVLSADDGLPATPRNEHTQLVRLGSDLIASSTGWIRRFDDATGSFVPEERLLVGGTPVSGVLVSGPGRLGSAWFRPGSYPGVLIDASPAPRGAAILKDLSIAPFRKETFNTLYEEGATHTLWLAGEGLLASIDLAWKPATSPFPPQIRVRSIVSAVGTLLGTGDTPLTLDHSQNALRISYALPYFEGDYHGRAQTEYRTRLEGLESDWTPWSRESSRAFTNLPYRALTLDIEARTPRSTPVARATYSFLIRPPWWLTTPALAGYGIAFALAIVGIVRLRTLALQHQNTRLEAEVEARTRQLARLNEELTDAVQIVSHDLRGPMSGIRALARQLRGSPHILSTAAGSEFLAEIERTSGAAVDLMARMLDLQRASDRAAGLIFAPADVGQIVREVCQQFAPAAAAKHASLRVEAPSLLRIIDSEGVASVIANLVSNAVKFIPPGADSAVFVSLSGTENTCTVIVADNGPGIPETERAQLFEKFSRGTARPTAGEASAGLGLYILSKFLGAMKGTIRIEPTPGGGATFIVTWPAEQSTGQLEQA